MVIFVNTCNDMQDRLLKLLTAKQLSATKFAELIGVQKSSISHILSGRNKPSFDFIEKVLHKFSEVNPEWLILGKGGMYRQSVQATLFDSTQEVPDKPILESPKIVSKQPEIEDDTHNNKHQYPYQSELNKKEVERVLIFFKDKTFSEYFPE